MIDNLHNEGVNYKTTKN